jgi:methylated-DNA-[protein]-cysteine S-methyltransferase
MKQRHDATSDIDVAAALRHAYAPTGGAAAPRVAYWTTTDSPIGRLLIATGEHGQVRRVTFDRAVESFVEGILAVGWLPIESRLPNGQLLRELDEFFDGRRHAFDISVDLSTLRPFHRAVLESCARIPYGAWDSYAGLALAIGNPRAARAVGNALGANPVPLLVPCHRVLAAGGRIGGYGGGLAIKRQLLRLEGVTMID